MPARMHMRHPARQDTVPAEREEDSRRAKNIARDKTRRGNRRASQQQQSPEVSEKRRGRFGERSGGLVRELRSQCSLRDKLNQNVERGRDREREIDRARHRPRRILDLAARDERDFDAEEREEEKQNGIAQGLRAGPTATPS